jgi:hypothetical protein
MIIGSMTLLSIQFSLQNSFSILITCSSAFVVKGFIAKNNTTFQLKDVKELTYAAFGKITEDVWTKAEEHVIKIEKEFCKENCIDQLFSD